MSEEKFPPILKIFQGDKEVKDLNTLFFDMDFEMERDFEIELKNISLTDEAVSPQIIPNLEGGKITITGMPEVIQPNSAAVVNINLKRKPLLALASKLSQEGKKLPAEFKFTWKRRMHIFRD